MKKILVSLLLFINTAMATMSNFSIDKTEVDYAKNEFVIISFTLAHYEKTNYRLYTGKNGQVFLDFDSPSDFDYLAVYPVFTVPVDLRAVTGDFLSPGETHTVVLNVREVRSSDGQIMQSQQFPITVKKNLSQNYEVNSRVTDPTGAWFDPALNGVGFVLMQVENGSVMYYYGYDAAGKRLWLISEVIDETWIKGEAKTLMMYEGQADANTNFTTPPANASGTVEWGKVEMRFDDCNSGSAKLSGADGEQTFTLVKLAVPGAVHCVKN